MKKLKNAPLFLIVFGFIILFSIADLSTPDREFSENENKYLAKMPEPTLSSLISGDFALDYEDYISDQFLLRDSWITAKSLSEMALLKTENNDVVYGKGGYLFPKFYQFNSTYLRNNLAAIDRFAANSAAPVYSMIIPSKYYPLIDKVPDGLPVVDQNYYINAVSEYLSENTTPVNVKDILTVHGDDYIYYRTDHHWTTYGAWLGYGQFAAKAGFTSFEYDAFGRTAVGGFLGTNYSRSKTFNPEEDTIEYYNFEIRSLTADGTEYDGLYNAGQFALRDKYAGFLYGNHGHTIIETEPDENKLDSILVIKDSFANSMIPMLTQHYNTIHVVDTRYTGDAAELLKLKFDHVLIMYSFENLVGDTSIATLGLGLQ